MDFLKKNYEKVLLGVVLLGLAIAVASLPFKIASDKQTLDAKQRELINPRVKPLTNLDLTLPEVTLKRVSGPAAVDFSPPNKLFNPLPWQQRADGTLIPGTKTGPIAAVVTNITPLHLRLTLDNVTVSDSGAKYVIGVQKEAAPLAKDRNKKQYYCTLNSKNDMFALVAANARAEDPTNAVVQVQLNDSGERVSISAGKPFQRVDGFMADVVYAPERKSWTNRRIGAVLIFNGEEYKIVAINENEVVLLAKNEKKWTIKYNPNLNAGL